MTIPVSLRRPLPLLLPPLLLASLLAACSPATTATLNGGVPSLATARTALATGSAPLALGICDAQLRLHPDDPSLLTCRGDALTALNRRAEAGAAYERAVAIDRTNSDAKVGLGRLRLSTDPRAAEALFLDALGNAPRNPVALNNLGIARDLQGRHADAQTAYGEAIAADPNDRAAQVNLALSLAMSGRTGEAVRILRPIAARPGATARERHDLAAALAMDGQKDEASRLLRQELDGPEADEAVAGFRALSIPR